MEWGVCIRDSCGALKEVMWMRTFLLSGDEGHVLWNGNWISYLDTLLQFHTFTSTRQGLRLYTRIKAVHIDPAVHLNRVIKFQNKPGKVIMITFSHARIGALKLSIGSLLDVWYGNFPIKIPTTKSSKSSNSWWSRVIIITNDTRVQLVMHDS